MEVRLAVAELGLESEGVGAIGLRSSSSTIVKSCWASARAAAEDRVITAGQLIGETLPGNSLKVVMLAPPDAPLRFSTKKKGIRELVEKNA